MQGPDYDEFSEKERRQETTRLHLLLLEWERAKQKQISRTQPTQMPPIGAVLFPSSSLEDSALPQIASVQVRILPTVLTGLKAANPEMESSSTRARKSQPTVPHLNGDINEPRQLRHRTQYCSPQNNRSGQSHLLSNSVVMYDEARGQFYTELA